MRHEGSLETVDEIAQDVSGGGSALHLISVRRVPLIYRLQGWDPDTATTTP